MAAFVAHRHTTATLRELARFFGLQHPDSVSNLVRRAERAIQESKGMSSDHEHIRELLKIGADP